MKTVKTTVKELANGLDGKINGLTLAVLLEMSLQDLQTLTDNMLIVKKTDGKKITSNLGTDIVAYFIANDIKEMKRSELETLISRLNLKNYFKLPAEYDAQKEFDLINVDILLKKIVSSKDGTEQANRQTEWLKRKSAYLNSHLTGVENSGSLFKNSNASSYFVEVDGVCTLTPKA